MSKKKQKSSDIAVSIVACLLMIIGLLAIMTCVFWVYIKLNPDKGPETHLTTYVNSIIDENGNERQFLEVHYWENKDGRGKKVLEISFNAYSGQDCIAVRQLGVQYVYEEETAMYNYTKDGAASWKSLGQEIVEPGKTNLYLKIDDMPIAVVMDGTYTVSHRNVSSKSVAETVLTLGLNKVFRSVVLGEHNVWDRDTYYETWEETRNYTMADFYNELASAVLSNNVGYGTNILSLVDLANYFTLKKAVGSIDEWTSLENYQEYQNEYFAVKVTKHRDGMLRANESDFGMFKDDADFTLIETDNMLTDYTGLEQNVILTYQDFDYRYCKEYGGYVAYVKDDVKNTLRAGRIDTVAILLDLSNTFFLAADYPIVGIMYDCINVSSIDLTFNQDTYPLFYEFYDATVGRKYIPTDAQYSVHNRKNEDCVVTHFSEVQI
ncbi:MAG: hypothetical protein NC037_01045 [Bacteroides sp.]|nr:hypothetical protein [Bacillota bacterium]MCM1393509.1 hypothetical protein [[Eubacterium] siraeum]MCM1455102.1 hypothetical protein [Bacteroides sp.]